MLVELSPDQEVLRESTANFLADRVPAAAVRSRCDSAASFGSASFGSAGFGSAGFELVYWRDRAELGWTSYGAAGHDAKHAKH